MERTAETTSVERELSIAARASFDPPARAAATGVEVIPGNTARGGDGTTLRFSHRGLPNEEAVQSHAHGWDHYLERLVTAAGGGDPGADPWPTREM